MILVTDLEQQTFLLIGLKVILSRSRMQLSLFCMCNNKLIGMSEIKILT